MAKFTLDDIRTAAEKKYGATEIELSDDLTVRLLNPIRLPKESRAALKRVQDRISALSDEESDGEDEDQIDLLGEALRIVSETSAQADALLALAGDDPGLLVTVFDLYTTTEALPEA